MLPIYICEDIEVELKYLSKIISDFVMIENLDMEVVCATPDPNVLLNALSKSKTQSLYFLDIDLGCGSDMNGFLLAEKVREMDSRAFIVISTTHDELKATAFDYRLEIMDYLVKDDLSYKKRVVECLAKVNKLYLAQSNNVIVPKFEYMVGNYLKSMPLQDIYTIEAYGNHRLLITGIDCTKDIFMTLKSAEKQLDGSFYRCHKSCIVNMIHISNICINDYTIKFDNNYSCIAAKRTFPKFREIYYAF